MSALVTIGDELRTIPAEDLRAATPMNAFFVVPMPASRRLTLDPARLFPSHPPLDQRLARLADAAHRLGRAVEAETPRSSLRAARRPRRRNPAALISCLAGIAYTVWMFAGTPVAFDTAAASVLLYGSGLGLALALYAVGRAQAGASGFIFASVGLAAFLLPTLLAVDGALSYFVALFLHLV
jgi:hypothetical protein